MMMKIFEVKRLRVLLEWRFVECIRIRKRDNCDLTIYLQSTTFDNQSALKFLFSEFAIKKLTKEERRQVANVCIGQSGNRDSIGK